MQRRKILIKKEERIEWIRLFLLFELFFSAKLDGSEIRDKFVPEILPCRL